MQRALALAPASAALVSAVVKGPRSPEANATAADAQMVASRTSHTPPPLAKRTAHRPPPALARTRRVIAWPRRAAPLPSNGSLEAAQGRARAGAATAPSRQNSRVREA